MAEDLERRRKRLRFRAWHRGTREMDMLLGGFADRHLDALDAAELARFEALLELGDPDLYAWVSGRERPPAAYDSDVLRLLCNFKIDPVRD